MKGLGDLVWNDALGDFVSSAATTTGLEVWGDNLPGGPIDAQLPSTSPSSPGFNWTSLLTTGLNDSARILGVRYAVPQLNPGQTIATSKSGTVMSQLPTGATQAVTAGLSTGMLLLIGAGVLFAFVISRK